MTPMAKKKPDIIVPAVDLSFEETMKRLLSLKPEKATEPDTKPDDLPLNCAYCGGAVTLQFWDYPNAANADGAPLDPYSIHQTRAEWHCPYCQRVNQGGFPGKLAWVVKRVEDSDAKH
jgi:hypothetical protein